MATREDATLLVQLLQWGTALGTTEAFEFIFSDDFDPDRVEVRNPQVHKALGSYEVVGTLVKQGLLDRNLVYDMWAIDAVWKQQSARSQMKPQA
jgi:hypothetical protein